MPTNHNTAIVIPFYNGDGYIKYCLDSIKESDFDSVNTYIINNSDKPTNIHDIVKEYKNIMVHDASARIGFGKASNLGAKLAIRNGADIVVILNQDIIIKNNCLRELVLPFYVDPHIYITAPINFTYDFKNIESFYVKFYLSQCPELIYDSLCGSTKRYYEVQQITGSCFAIRSKIINKIGFFDPLYFMYFEDDDLCRRIRYLNKKIVIISNGGVAHKHSHTNIDMSGNTHRWKRISKTIYILKELNNSIFHNILKATRNNLSDYFNSVARLKVISLLEYIIDDLRLFSKIHMIINSRRAEKNINSCI